MIAVLLRTKKPVDAISKILGWSPEKIERVRSYSSGYSTDIARALEYSLPDWKQLGRIGKITAPEADEVVADLSRIMRDVETAGILEFVERLLALPRDCLPSAHRDARVDELTEFRRFLAERIAQEPPAAPAIGER